MALMHPNHLSNKHHNFIRSHKLWIMLRSSTIVLKINNLLMFINNQAIQRPRLATSKLLMIKQFQRKRKKISRQLKLIKSKKKRKKSKNKKNVKMKLIIFWLILLPTLKQSTDNHLSKTVTNANKMTKKKNPPTKTNLVKCKCSMKTMEYLPTSLLSTTTPLNNQIQLSIRNKTSWFQPNNKNDNKLMNMNFYKIKMMEVEDTWKSKQNNLKLKLGLRAKATSIPDLKNWGINKSKMPTKHFWNAWCKSST